MATHVILQNPKTNETKTVKVGFSFVLFFFCCPLYGIPLFLRGLHQLGAVIAGLMVLFGIGIVSQPTLVEAAITVLLCGAVMFGIELWLGIKGNEMTVKNYLQKGWIILDPDSIATKHAINKWGLVQASAPRVELTEDISKNLLPRKTDADRK